MQVNKGRFHFHQGQILYRKNEGTSEGLHCNLYILSHRITFSRSILFRPEGLKLSFR
ncbi:hypothetical protein B0H10DRAFT_485431 [Mycena sp. CBHHK59/15]|nr:hypothetical protein B0H10DRAFT_485431 [Mycena sp. CBHHK59/15]